MPSYESLDIIFTRLTKSVFTRLRHALRKAVREYHRDIRRRRAEFLRRGKHGMRRPR